MVIRWGTWGIWTDCAEVRAELLDGVLKSGFESSFQKWFRVQPDHLNMKPLDSIGPLESMEPLDPQAMVPLDPVKPLGPWSCWAIWIQCGPDSLVLWITRPHRAT